MLSYCLPVVPVFMNHSLNSSLTVVFFDSKLKNNKYLTMPRISRSAGSITELVTDEIAYTDGLGVLDSTANLGSQQPVSSVATSGGGLVQRGARSLLFGHFGFPTGLTVQGIELELAVDRLSRVEDSVIQLWYNGGALGANRADRRLDNLKIYGGVSDLWSVPTSFSAWSDSEFAVLVDFTAHRDYPSRNTVYFRSLTLSLYTD